MSSVFKKLSRLKDKSTPEEKSIGRAAGLAFTISENQLDGETKKLLQADAQFLRLDGLQSI